MTMKAKTARTPTALMPMCRPSGAIVEVTHYDEAGRPIVYTVQVTAAGIACWTSDDNGGSITIPALFAACCQSTAARV